MKMLWQAQIASKLGIPVSDVKNVIIWGNHSSTQFPDLRHATALVNGQEVPVYDAIKDDAYLKGDFITVSSWSFQSFIWLLPYDALYNTLQHMTFIPNFNIKKEST